MESAPTGALRAVILLGLISGPGLYQDAFAMPGFARQYNVSCTVCHSAVPRLNAYGEEFAGNNYRMPNWEQASILEVGDDQLRLPKIPPFGIRAQGFVQGRDGEEVDPQTGPTGNESEFDFQSPYLIKLISSAPLSENLTYYFYGIFAEKGHNGETLIEDAWFRHADVFGTGVGLQLGQFQISDLMFPREVRLTFQDFYAYRAAGITYDRGVIFDRDIGPVGVGVGITNGEGIEQNFPINSPGYRRPDRMFDNDNQKTVFGRIGVPVGPMEVGLFGLVGEQRSAGGFAAMDPGTRDTDKRIVGLDLAGTIGDRYHWFAQILWNRWEEFLDAAPGQDFDWVGGFAGVDYLHSDRWVYSVLYNYADANDFEDTDTIFEGIEINSLTFTASYYFMRNIKAVLELNADLLDRDRGGPPFVGHQTREHYALFGFDTAF